MKLERISLRHFLSHDETDWAPDGARLVTLVGANGAGKSAILDGVQYALFDAARGRTDDLVQMGATDMSAAVEFTFAGARYRVSRGRSTKSGGRSFLELAIADGEAWRPLTGDTIRETQAAIEALLRLDAATFATAVLLSQGKASAFAEATAGERKRILGQVLGLDVYALAEARARELARDVEARVSAERGSLARLDEQLAARSDLESDAAVHADAVAHWAGEVARLAAERETTEADLRGATAAAAGYDVAVAELQRLDEEIGQHRDRYRRAVAQRQSAEAAIVRDDETLSKAHEVAVACERLDGLRLQVEQVDAIDRSAVMWRQELERETMAKLEIEDAHTQALRAWQGRMSAAEGEAKSLEAAIAGLQPVTCPKCRTTFHADPAGLRERLAAAKEAMQAVGPAPEIPIRVMRHEGQIMRVKERLADVAEKTADLRNLRADLVATERIAALAGAMKGAREGRAAAVELRDDAIRAIEAVNTAGQDARERIAEVTARRDAAAERRHHQEQIEQVLVRLTAERETTEQRHGIAIALQARAAGALEELDRVQRRRDEAVGMIAGQESELARLRRLVAAFGVTGIPARIIEGVLPELTAYAQGLLEQLRPGMTLSLRAQRAKKDGKGVVEALDLVVRDDAGERPLALFSGGERMSVSLALAVGLSRLVARRAGTAIRTLVIDEPDGLDADARRAFGLALRTLAHQGELERVVLVSHHQDLADVGDAVYAVSKAGNGSVVEQIA